MRSIIIASLTLIAFMLYCSGVFRNEAMYGVIHADAQGYYGYLIAVFIERTFDWGQVIESYADIYFGGVGADFTVETEFGRVNKYFAGTAILIMPFFLASCLIAWLSGVPVDGYSAPFQSGLVITALAYVGLGLYFLTRFLESNGFKRGPSIFASAVLLFATDLFHYSISEPAMSHAYSFALVCMFLYLTDAWLKKPGENTLCKLAIVFGLIVLVRPINGVVVLSMPFVAGGLKPVVSRVWQEPLRYKIAVLLLVSALVSIQSAVYMVQVGRPMVWSYKGEGFNFLAPEILNVLFSYKKGFFVYAPVALLGLAGIAAYSITDRKKGLWLLLFLSVAVYVVSCWWNWYYGASLGMRAMIEYLPFFSFGLAFILSRPPKWAKVGVVLTCLLFGGVNLVQSYQYQKFILHWDDMNKDRFWKVFLRTSRKYDGIFYRNEATAVMPKDEQILHRTTFYSGFEEAGNWGTQGIVSDRSYEGGHSTRVTTDDPYGSTLGIPVTTMGPTGKKILVIEAMVWTENPEPNLAIGYSYRNAGGDYGHNYIGLGHFLSERASWIAVRQVAELADPVDTTSDWIVYPFMAAGGEVYIDNLKYEVITLKEEINPTSEQP